MLVHSADAARPSDAHRIRKAAGDTVPLGLALALQPGDRGVIYAGLPTGETAAPLRVNAQFIPITSRTGLASTRGTEPSCHCSPICGSRWSKDLVGERPVAAGT